MTPTDTAVTRTRLRAPQEDRTALVEPALADVPELLEHNRQLLQRDEIDVGGRSLRRLGDDARREFLTAARRYTSEYRDVEVAPASADAPIFITGHQPTIFHPGVWFKNFVSGGLARCRGGTAVNLLIDSDTVGNPVLRVPGGTLRSPTTQIVAFDSSIQEIPYEEQPILDESLFGSFDGRVCEQLSSLIDNPLLREYWPLVTARGRATCNLGLSLAQGRHLLERQMGLATLEIPQSQVCRLPAAHWLIAYLLTELGRFREVYNESVRQYRKVNRIRSLNHPVPELAADDGWTEAPLWVWRSDRPRRRGLFVRRVNNELELSDHRGWRFSIPSSRDGDVGPTADALDQLAQRGVKIRTRALSTTLLARLLLGDVFLHGIGGAKYDQLTDALFQQFFGLEPPRFMVLSATIKLPLPREEITPEDLRRADQMLRDLAYHPEHHVDPSKLAPDAARAAQELIDAKLRWVATPPTADNARRRCHEIRRANEGLQDYLTGQRSKLESQSVELDRQLRAGAALGWREYGFCLYPKRTLYDFYAGNSCFQTVGYGA